MAEVAFRLSYGQSLTVDVGANFGYVTLVMATALSGYGRCHAFEPVPEIYQQLIWNCGTALNPQLASRIVSHNVALSNKDRDSVISQSRHIRMKAWRALLMSQVGVRRLTCGAHALTGASAAIRRSKFLNST